MKSSFNLGVALCAIAGAMFQIVLNGLILLNHPFVQCMTVLIILIPGLLITLFCKKGLEMNSIKILVIDLMAISAGIYIAALVINGGTPIFHLNQ